MTRRRIGTMLTLLGAVAIIASACSALFQSAPPRPTAGPPALDLVNIDRQTRAVVLALADNTLFTSAAIGDGGIGPRDESLIGQSNWYTVEPLESGSVFIVTVRLGWGDCPAGCINEHLFRYTVTPAGITVRAESGDPLPDVPLEGSGWSSLVVNAGAGPTCPVESASPDPACADRAVVANITATPLAGEAVMATTDKDGQATLALAPGVYLIVAEAHEAFLMPTPLSSVISTGPTGSAHLSFSFDTGIR